MSAENALTQDEVIPQLWQEYCRDKEYLSGAKFGIRRDHPIVLRREEEGLGMLYKKYVQRASFEKVISPLEIIKEIKDMHNLLFKYVFPVRGEYRNEERRIGDYYDESMKLPSPIEIPAKMAEYAGWLNRLDLQFIGGYVEKCYLLADIHLRLVMIHPFMDGNGRIARAIADKYAVKMGLPPVLEGYPRIDKQQQRKYHEAIKSSRTGRDVKPLALWIKSYLDAMMEKLA